MDEWFIGVLQCAVTELKSPPALAALSRSALASVRYARVFCLSGSGFGAPGPNVAVRHRTRVTASLSGPRGRSVSGSTVSPETQSDNYLPRPTRVAQASPQAHSASVPVQRRGFCALGLAAT